MSEYIDTLKEKPPDYLYHYTSQRGLIEIVRTKTIWATSIHHLNDATEFQYTLDLMAAEMKERDPVADARTTEIFIKLYRQLIGITNLNIYVSCFSENADVLSQWRGYCANGSGFTVGLDGTALEQPMNRQRFRFVKCVYDVQKQKRLIREILDRAVTQAASVFDDVGKLKETVIAFARHVVLLAPTLKHPDFSEEQEWRLVSPPTPRTDKTIKLREGRFVPIPYKPFELTEQDQPLRKLRIKVGPNPHADLAVQSIRTLIHCSGVAGADVQVSSIPYRGW